MGMAAEVEESPITSMRSMAKAVSVRERTIRRSIGDSWRPWTGELCQLLTNASKAAGVNRRKKLITWLKHHGSTVKIFSNKKMWTVDQAKNARNNRFLAMNQTKHPAGMMMLGVITSDGQRMPLYWFPRGLKIGTKEYLDVLQTVKPWIDATYPEGGYC